MTDFGAIAGVSQTLRTLLSNGMDLPPAVSPAPSRPLPVSIGIPPSDELLDNDPLLNLFLYRVTENPSLKNQEIPGRGQPGSYGSPPLSLVLHYLVTTYGSTDGSTTTGTTTDERAAQQLLGSAMRLLHDNAVITEGSRVGAVEVLDPTLRGEYEKVKLTLEPLSLEDVSKVWTALNRPYRLSVAYQASVVQIESRKQRRYARPVGEPPGAGPGVYVLPGRSPLIREIRGGRLRGPYASVGDGFAIDGEHLAADRTRVTIGPVDATASIDSVSAGRVTLRVPDEPALQPGAQPIRVGHDLYLPPPADAVRESRSSNTGVLMLVPQISGAAYDAATRQLEVTGTRLHHPDLQCLALIGEAIVPSLDWTTATPTSIAFDVPAEVADGTHVVRVRVNEAEALDFPEVTIS